MGKLTIALDRIKLIRDLEILRPVSGSEVKKAWNSVRFSLLRGEDNEIQVFLYGTNGQNFTCVFNSKFKVDESFSNDPDYEHHFLIDLEKLLKICKSSFVEKVLIKEVQEEVRSPEGELQKQGKYEIVTEGRNSLTSYSVDDFLNESFAEVNEIARYPVNTFGAIWQKASIAKGEFDLRKTCLHYDGNFLTLDSSFACIVLAKDEIKPAKEFKYSINLDTGITHVLKKITGQVVISSSKSGPRIVFAAPDDGIFISVIPVNPANIPYMKVLTLYEWANKCVISRVAFENCLKRARAFVDKNYTSAISIKTMKLNENWYMRISTIEDLSTQIFEEDIILDECNSELDAAYNSLNFLKIFDALEKEKIVISWRNKGVDKNDKTMLIVEEGQFSTTNIVIPHMAVSR